MCQLCPLVSQRQVLGLRRGRQASHDLADKSWIRPNQGLRLFWQCGHLRAVETSFHSQGSFWRLVFIYKFNFLLKLGNLTMSGMMENKFGFILFLYSLSRYVKKSGVGITQKFLPKYCFIVERV